MIFLIREREWEDCTHANSIKDLVLLVSVVRDLLKLLIKTPPPRLIIQKYCDKLDKELETTIKNIKESLYS